MKIGLIQTQGVGDILIALPIAKYFADRGHEVVWPVNKLSAQFFRLAVDYVTFLEVTPDLSMQYIDYAYHIPLKLLKEVGCDKHYVLNMDLPGEATLNGRLAGSLKFDEYKYALTGVPFSEKWNLQINRDLGREMTLHKALNLDGRPYICVHSTTSGNFQGDLILPASWHKKYQIVNITSISDSPLDWVYTIEHAAKRIMVDSMFANLTEQLHITGENYLVQRSVTALTPVYKNGWRFRWAGDTLVDQDEA